MKKASLRDLQHHLSEIMRYVDHGEEVQITKRNRVVARLVPEYFPHKPKKWPDFAQRARSIIKKPKGKPLSEIVLEDRQERL
jgi:prevent-host-death family protein